MFALALQEEWIERDPTKGIKHSRRFDQAWRADAFGPEEEKSFAPRPRAPRSGERASATSAEEGGRVTEEEVSWDQTASPPSYLRPVIVTALGTGLRRERSASSNGVTSTRRRGCGGYPAAS